MLVIAHRGNNREAPENSREAFQKSVDCGAHRIEMDLQWTKDNRIVIFHDDNLKRVTGVNRNISGTDWRLLNKEVALPNGESLPELPEILETFLPRAELNLEIKGVPGAENMQELVRLTQEVPDPDRIIFSSFHPESLEVLRDLAPGLNRAVLWGRDTLKVSPGLYINPEKFMERCESAIFHPEAELVTGELMVMAKKNGWRVFPWVPMSGEGQGQKEILWKKLRDMGVDGLCTNDPASFKHWLEERV